MTVPEGSETSVGKVLTPGANGAAAPASLASKAEFGGSTGSVPESIPN